MPVVSATTTSAGWELLEQLRDLGFVDVTALDYWSAAHGYLGSNTLLFMARKPAG